MKKTLLKTTTNSITTSSIPTHTFSTITNTPHLTTFTIPIETYILSPKQPVITTTIPINTTRQATHNSTKSLSKSRKPHLGSKTRLPNKSKSPKKCLQDLNISSTMAKSSSTYILKIPLDLENKENDSALVNTQHHHHYKHNEHYSHDQGKTSKPQPRPSNNPKAPPHESPAQCSLALAEHLKPDRSSVEVNLSQGKVGPIERIITPSGVETLSAMELGMNNPTMGLGPEKGPNSQGQSDMKGLRDNQEMKESQHDPVKLLVSENRVMGIRIDLFKDCSSLGQVNVGLPRKRRSLSQGNKGLESRHKGNMGYSDKQMNGMLDIKINQKHTKKGFKTLESVLNNTTLVSKSSQKLLEPSLNNTKNTNHTKPLYSARDSITINIDKSYNNTKSDRSTARPSSLEVSAIHPVELSDSRHIEVQQRRDEIGSFAYRIMESIQSMEKLSSMIQLERIRVQTEYKNAVEGVENLIEKCMKILKEEKTMALTNLSMNYHQELSKYESLEHELRNFTNEAESIKDYFEDNLGSLLNQSVGAHSNNNIEKCAYHTIMSAYEQKLENYLNLPSSFSKPQSLSFFDKLTEFKFKLNGSLQVLLRSDLVESAQLIHKKALSRKNSASGSGKDLISGRELVLGREGSSGRDLENQAIVSFENKAIFENACKSSDEKIVLGDNTLHNANPDCFTNLQHLQGLLPLDPNHLKVPFPITHLGLLDHQQPHSCFKHSTTHLPTQNLTDLSAPMTFSEIISSLEGVNHPKSNANTAIGDKPSLPSPNFKAK